MNYFNSEKIYKSKTSDPTMTEDKTYDNYIALAGAILLDEKHKDYNRIVHNKDLYDKEEEKKRIKEIEEKRLKGEKTELQIWYEAHSNKKVKNKESYKVAALSRQKKLQMKKEKLLEKFKDEIKDVSKMDYEEIRKYKIKVININDETIQIFNSRNECSKAIGILPRSITTYMRAFRIYNNKFYFTISDDIINDEDLAKIVKSKVGIRATNQVTKEVKIFKKIKDTADFFGLNYVTFHQNFKYKNIKQIDDWILEEIV